MMSEETVLAHNDLKGKVLLPIHWGKFNLSLHSWTEPIERILTKAKELNVNVITPIIGQSIVLNENVSTEKWWRNYIVLN